MSPADLAKDDDFQLHFIKIEKKFTELLTEWQRVQCVAHKDNYEEAGRRVLLVQEFLDMLDACRKPEVTKEDKPKKRKRLHPQK